MNWLDILILLIVIGSAASGFTQGLVRIGFGMAALAIGFFLASWFYGLAGGWFIPYVSSRALANVFGFLLIFVSVLVLGSLIAGLIVRALRLVGLSWADRILGAGFGFLRGLIVVVVGLMILTAFNTRPPRAVLESEAAPYALKAARLLSAATPYEIKSGFQKTYGQMQRMWSSAVGNTGRVPRHDD